MLVLTVDQLVSLGVSYKDAYGNEAIVDGSPAWNVSDASVIALEVGSGGFGVKAVTTGKVGSCQISVTADADLGEGVKSLVATLDVNVTAAEASVASIAVGAPELKPVVVTPVEPTPVPAPEPVVEEPAPVVETPVEPTPEPVVETPVVEEPAPAPTPEPVVETPVEPTPEPVVETPVEPTPENPTPENPAPQG
jgi:hypothetical protein